MRDRSFYIKTVGIVLLLFLESYYLTQLITAHVLAQNYFSVSLGYSAQVVLGMLSLLYTFSLSVGAWGDWEQYVLIPAPISLAIFLAIFPYSSTYALIVTTLFGLLLIHDIHKSTKLKNILIKFIPKVILRLATGGVLRIFSVLGGLLVILHSAHTLQTYDLGKQLTDMVKEPIKNVVNKQLQTQMEEHSLLIPEIPAGLNLSEANPEAYAMLKNLGLSDILDQTKTSKPNFNTDELVETQINKLIEPYKSLIQPVMALLVFGLFQFYATIVTWIFVATINAVFWLALKTKFIKIIQVETIQETIHY